MYNLEFSVQIKPHGEVSPIITYGVGENINTTIVDKPLSLNFNLNLENGDHIFFIEFANKTNDTLDMAVEIESVTFEGMTLDRFKWASKYYPNYPEPWASQQTKVLPRFQESATYLGWNGRWELEFSTPIFHWIHRLENLGWIYS